MHPVLEVAFRVVGALLAVFVPLAIRGYRRASA